MKPWIIAGLCCIGAGVVLSTAAIAAGALNPSRYVKKLDLTDQTDTPEEEFHSVIIDAEYADITIQPGETVSVEAEYIEADTYSVTVQDDMLQIQQKYQWKNSWYRHIQLGPISAPIPKITVTLPEESYQAIAVGTDCGKCSISGVEMSTLSIDADCGECTIQDVDAASCTIICELGDVTIDNSTISGTAMLDADCGEITLEQTTIGNACKIEADLGDVNLTDVSCAWSEITLDCGSLAMTDCKETDKDKDSTITLSLGDLDLKNCTLYQLSCELECGSMDAVSTALYGNTVITAELGDIDLNLLGRRSDYNVISSFADSYHSDSENVVEIAGDSDVVDISVSFTE
ncbi:MAG: DUF4097 family beta strand repeat-containing protein [Ruminococcus sp.]